jgi:hypothetical protein
MVEERIDVHAELHDVRTAKTLRTKVSTKRRSLEIYLTQCGTKNDFTVF